MSLADVKLSTDRLRDVVVTEKAKGVPQIDLVKNSHDYARDVMAKTYSTSPKIIDGLASSFLNFLNSSDETLAWYETWKRGDNPEFWSKAQAGFLQYQDFKNKTSQLDEKGKTQMVRPLSWLVISDQFVTENTPPPGPEIPAAPVEVIQPNAVIMSTDAESSGYKSEEEPQDNDPKQVYAEKVKDAGKKLTDFLDEYANDDTWVGWLVNILASNEATLGGLAVTTNFFGIYSGADAVVALNGYNQWKRGVKQNDKMEIETGQRKMVMSAIPFLPASMTAPTLNRIDTIKKWIKK